MRQKKMSCETLMEKKCKQPEKLKNTYNSKNQLK